MTPPQESNLDWEISLQKLYNRRQADRPLQEGDPRKFLPTAAEITRRTKEIPPPSDPALPIPPIHLPNWEHLCAPSFFFHDLHPTEPETLRPEVILGKWIWEVAQQFGTDEAYLLLMLITQAGETEQPWQMPITLEIADLPIILGWDKSRPDEPILPRLTPLLTLLNQALARLLTLNIVDTSAQNVTSHTLAQYQSPLWFPIGKIYHSRISRNISDSIQQTVHRSAYPQALQVTLMPGYWVQTFLELNPHAIESLTEFSQSAKALIRINPTRKKLAARLALFLTAIEPLHPSATYRVRDLLSEVEPDKNLETYHKTDETQTRLFVRWNNALRALKNLDWIIEFDDNTYPSALRPIWSSDDDIDSPLPGRFDNWFNTWLDGKLLLCTSPPEPRIENIRMGDRRLGSIISRPKRQRPSAPAGPAPITGKTLNVALTLKGWSKAQLSYQLHMDRSMVTHWIKGSRPISEEQRKRLWKILGRELLAAQKLKY
jgi:hypothetical protein